MMERKVRERKYYLHICGAKDKHAGSKAVDDCQCILERNGYKPIIIYRENNKSDFFKKLDRYYRYLKIFFIKRNSTLVIQHPLPMPSFYLKMLSIIKEKHNVRLVYLIHDLDSLRKIRLDDIELVQKRDTMMYQNADVIISHNGSMKKYLVEKCGISGDKIIELGIFDYLLGDMNRDSVSKEEWTENSTSKVVIAGNLAKEKSGYIYKLIDQNNESLKFNLYGVSYSGKETNKSCTYKGAFSPEELPMKMEGYYGLVWDGAELNCCAGTVGEYLKYNNPHKVSLYIASEMPIIIWEKAALAKFVKDNNIGITVSSLYELPEVLSKVTKQEYQMYKYNLSRLSADVKNGKYLTEALSKI